MRISDMKAHRARLLDKNGKILARLHIIKICKSYEEALHQYVTCKSHWLGKPSEPEINRAVERCLTYKGIDVWYYESPRNVRLFFTEHGYDDHRGALRSTDSV